MNADNQKLIQILSGNITSEYIFKQQQYISNIIPEIKPMIGMQQNNPNHCYTVWEHTVYSIISVTDNIILRLTMLFHDIAKPYCYTQDENGIGHFYGHPKYSSNIAAQILKRLEFDNAILDIVCKLIFYHDAQIPSKAVSVKRWLNKLGEEHFKMLIAVKKADIKAQSHSVQEQKLEQLKKLEQKLTEVIQKSHCFSKKDLVITGYDLIQLGIPQGKEIGRILTLLVYHINQNHIQNEKQQLLQTAKNIYFHNHNI